MKTLCHVFFGITLLSILWILSAIGWMIEGLACKDLPYLLYTFPCSLIVIGLLIVYVLIYNQLLHLNKKAGRF